MFELKDLKDLPTPKEIEELSQSRLDEEAEDNDTHEENIEPSRTSDGDKESAIDAEGANSGPALSAPQK